MIKRVFYSIDHPNDNDCASDNSSSSSEDDPEPIREHSKDGKSEEEETTSATTVVESQAWPGQLTSDDNGESELLPDSFKQKRRCDSIDREKINIAMAQEKHSNQWAEAVEETEKDRALHNLDDCVIKCKSVFKCKLCPRIVCLYVDKMEAYLVSKVYAIFRTLIYDVRRSVAN